MNFFPRELTQQRQPKEGKANLQVGPIPISDVNLQKDRPVCFEGHGNHYDTDISWVSITDTATTAVNYMYQLASSSHYQLATIVNYNVVLLSDIVVSLMAGSTTSLPMSFEHEYQSAMPTPHYTTTAYASAGYYTTTYDPTSYCTDALPIPISDVNLQKDRPVCFEDRRSRKSLQAHVYYTTIASECYMVIYAALNYYTEASKCYTINVQPICKQGYCGYQTATLLSYYTTYVTTCYYNGTSNYYTEKAEYYTRTCATPVYYIEEPKHYSAPSYNRSVYYTTIDPDCYAAPNRYIEASKYYTIEGKPIRIDGLLPYYLTTSTYASPTYYTDACKYYTSKAPRVLHEYLRSSELLNGSITLLPSYINKTSEYYTEDLKYTSKGTKYYSTNYAVLSYHTDASK
ncbi:hypothetical protein DAPPUDRAFT_249174 [Daphnia pulex]|uniref:Uncharacterized protein n=1 Tax=Daphnia pulex TaxID=6669 RepID=E9GW15_DAPPU|nr:hypothetical protein DAPPUDRAFT_249174 [Daphnia pulex]|eukprot:EFX76351.1 hypothetical protein DAPPUDRAFT_249174 [Daphnia pulex]